jgi:hypothetical protein
VSPPGSVSTGPGSSLGPVDKGGAAGTTPAADKAKALEMIATMAKTATVFADSETDLDLGAYRARCECELVVTGAGTRCDPGMRTIRLPCVASPAPPQVPVVWLRVWCLLVVCVLHQHDSTVVVLWCVGVLLGRKTVGACWG